MTRKKKQTWSHAVFKRLMMAARKHPELIDVFTKMDKVNDTDIKQKRINLRLSQGEFAKICDVNQNWLSLIENGKAEIPVYFAHLIAVMERDEKFINIFLKDAECGKDGQKKK